MYTTHKHNHLPDRSIIREAFRDGIKNTVSRIVIANWARDFISDPTIYPGDHIVIDALIFLATIDQTSSNHEYIYTQNDIEKAHNVFEQAIALGEHKKDLYTKVMFGRELQWHTTQEYGVDKIAHWASKEYSKNKGRLEEGLSNILSEISSMDCDPQFELSKEQLLALASNLIKNDTNNP